MLITVFSSAGCPIHRTWQGSYNETADTQNQRKQDMMVSLTLTVEGQGHSTGTGAQEHFSEKQDPHLNPGGCRGSGQGRK